MNLKKRVEELEQKLAEALRTIEELKKENVELRELVKEKSVPSFVKEDVRIYHHKSGQKEGHEGVSRETPERIDEIKEHKLKTCPICENKVSKTQETRERVTEDVEQPRTKNTKHIIHRYFCKHCNKIVEPIVTDALPNARF